MNARRLCQVRYRNILGPEPRNPESRADSPIPPLLKGSPPFPHFGLTTVLKKAAELCFVAFVKKSYAVIQKT